MYIHIAVASLPEFHHEDAHAVGSKGIQESDR